MPRLAAHSCCRTCWGALQSDIGCVGDMTRAKKILIAMSFASLLCNALDAQDDSDRVNSNIGATVSFPLSPLRKLCTRVGGWLEAPVTISRDITQLSASSCGPPLSLRRRFSPFACHQVATALLGTATCIR